MIGCLSCGHLVPYCDRCVAVVLEQVGGAAGARGIGWAQHVAAELGGAAPASWPPFEGKAAAIARRKVAGLCTDDRVLEALAVRCHAEAARWWARAGRTR